MIRVKRRLSGLRASVLHQAVILFLLTPSCEGQAQAVVATVGRDAILPCQLPAAVDAVGQTVEWARTDLRPSVVHVRRGGVELTQGKSPLYAGRTSLSVSRLRCGDLSLKLSGVKLSDAGSYSCLVTKSEPQAVVELIVGSVSSADIEISKISSGVLLVCKSAGWFPEPEVLWLDGEGNLLPAGPPETLRGPDGLYTVSSRVTVEKHSSSFTCRVQQKDINQTREAHIYVAADLFMVQTNVAARVIICLSVCVTAVVSVVVFVWKKGQNQKATTHSSEMWPLMDGDDPMTPRDKMKYLERRTAKLEEDLKKITSEKQHVEHVITELQKQKEGLKKQTNTLRLLQSEDGRELEEINKKLNEKKIRKSDQKREMQQNAQKAVEERKEKHDEMLKVTEEQVKITEDLINHMMEMKGKLERDKEQTEENLRDLERRRETTEETVESEEEAGTKDQTSAESSVQTK